MSGSVTPEGGSIVDDQQGLGAAIFRPLATAERRFVNSVGNEILIDISTGVAADRLCKTCMYGPDSGFENYTTWDELVQMHSALSEVLGISERCGALEEAAKAADEIAEGRQVQRSNANAQNDKRAARDFETMAGEAAYVASVIRAMQREHG